MGIIPLIPKTKMADACKYLVSGKPLAKRTTWSVLKTMSALQFHPAFLEPTSSSNTLALFHISLTGPTHSLFSVTSRENTITLSFQLTAINCHKNVYVTQPFS